MNRKKFLPIALIAGVVVIVGLIVWQVMSGKGILPESWSGVEGEPVPVTLDFYEAWLAARQAGPDEPFSQGLLEYQQVGKDLRDRLATYQGKLGEAGTEDPVLCQTDLPGGLRTLPVFSQDDSAQVLVMSTTKGQSGQAVVDLKSKNGLWQITNISCGNAEQAPQGEFSFDKSGFLLKQVPAPLDSKNWHLVFQEAGVLGHAVPLFFDSSSVCVKKDGSTSACGDDVLSETAPAHVQGELTETGVQVKRLELIDSVDIQ